MTTALATRGRDFAPSAMLALVAAASIAIVVALPPSRAMVLLVLAGVTLGTVAQPRLAYILLPISIPWGSEFTLAAGRIPITASDSIVFALLIGWCAQRSRTSATALPSNRWITALLLFILAMVISTWNAASIVASVKELVKWSEVLVVVWLAPAYLQTRKDIWIVITATIGAAAAEAVLGLAQVALNVGPHAFLLRGGLLRAYGTFGQPNPMAGYLNMVLPLVVAVAWGRRSLSVGAVAVLVGVGSIATQSRSGWAAGALALIIVAALYSAKVRRWIPIAIMGGLGLATLVALSLVPTGPFAHVASSFGVTAVNFQHYNHANFSEVERAAHWVAGLRMFEAHPFIGVGIGNYATVYPAYHVGAFVNALGHAHNYFINIAAEAGIFGLFAFTFLLVAGITYSASVAWRCPSGSLAGMLGVGVTGLWVSSTFHSLFDVLYVHELPTLIGVLMGALTVASRLDSSRASTTMGGVSGHG